jgi:Phage derived protein Gp49-like (DUF891)
MPRWSVAQFGDVVDRFRPDCPPDAWDDLIMRYSALVEKGRMCGKLTAKKLVNGKDIWELLGHARNCQPRLLFYFQDDMTLIVFVYAFIKQSNSDYKNAIAVSQSRRALIKRGERPTHVVKAFEPTQVH